MIAAFKKAIYRIVPKKTKVLVIPTDEELMIAELSYSVVRDKI